MNRRVASLLLAPVLVAACSASPTGSAAPVGPLQLPRANRADETMTVGGLRDELLSLADVALGQMRRLNAASDVPTSNSATRAYVQRVQADVAAVTVALAIEPDPEDALQDLMASTMAKRIAMSDLAPEGVNPAVRNEVVAALTTIEKQVWDLGSTVYSGDELQALRSRIGQWWSVTSPRPAVGVISVKELPAPSTGELRKGLFAPIVETNRQVEEARLLGERFLFLAERLPTITMWEAQAAAWDMAAGPEGRRALDGMSVITSAVETLAIQVDNLPALLDSQREAFLTAFDEREGAVSDLLVETGDLVREAGPLLESGERTVELTNDALVHLADALEATDRLLAGLRDANAPGGALAIDIAAYEGAIADVRASAEALNEALSQAEGLSELPRAMIDHAAWRVAQLMFLFFGLIVVYRLAMPRLGAAIGRD